MKKIWTNRWTWAAFLALLGLVFWFWILPYRFTALALWGVAAALTAYGLAARLALRRPTAGRWVRTALNACLCLVLAAMAVTEGFILSAAGGTREPESPYVVVLGAGVRGSEPSRALSERLHAALAYLEDHPDAICVVTGGQGGGEDVTEAQCMYDWLTARGVDPDRIWREEQATSTQENLRYSLALIQDRTCARPDAITVVSSEYHLFRAGLMARDQGAKLLGVPAQTHPLLQRIHYEFREIFGVWFYLLFGR